MSVIVTNLNKNYGSQTALQGVSFTAKQGQITGFLGPNGAGKSTTMKIITGYIPATSGKAEVCGIDVSQNQLEAKRKIGYLPEHNPLYLDMYVHEYLALIASVYGIANKSERIAEMIETVGLTREQNKKIGALSKGYRQRVGLAQALVHDPEVLVLDEPLTGLDPNQIVEIRSLIKELGKNKTVIFSTHIMQEVQYLCDRVLVINKGKLVADKSLEELKNSGKTTKSIVIEMALPISTDSLLTIAGVEEVILLSDNQVRIIHATEADIRQELFRWAGEGSNSLLSLKAEEESLESIFQKLTA